MIHQLPKVEQSELTTGLLYVWVPNGNDPKVVRLSYDGSYIMESGASETDYWEMSVKLSGDFYGPMIIDGVDATELIQDDEDEE